MEVRTVKIDVSKILEELWDRFHADMEESEKISKDDQTLFNETYEDGRACKYCLDVLRWCKLISDDECSDMALRVDEYIESVLDNWKSKTA